MQNLTDDEIIMISKSYHNGIQGIVDDLSKVVNSPNTDNKFSSKTRRFAKIDLATARNLLKKNQ